jgi:2,3-bisphosphoglycerate-independent phosphoglycerate mutase
MRSSRSFWVSAAEKKPVRAAREPTLIVIGALAVVSLDGAAVVGVAVVPGPAVVAGPAVVVVEVLFPQPATSNTRTITSASEKMPNRDLVFLLYISVLLMGLLPETLQT